MMPLIATPMTLVRPKRSLRRPHQPVVSALSTPWAIVMTVVNWAAAFWTSGDLRHLSGSSGRPSSTSVKDDDTGDENRLRLTDVRSAGAESSGDSTAGDVDGWSKIGRGTLGSAGSVRTGDEASFDVVG